MSFVTGGLGAASRESGGIGFISDIVEVKKKISTLEEIKKTVDIVELKLKIDCEG